MALKTASDRRNDSWPRRPITYALYWIVLTAVLAACTPAQLVDYWLAPPGSTSTVPAASQYPTPMPTATPPPVRPRPLDITLSKLSVKPGDQQVLIVGGTPQTFVNVLVVYANGDSFNQATTFGAQLDLSGQWIKQWTLDSQAPGGTVTVIVQEVLSGLVVRDAFQVDARPWGGPAPDKPPPVIAEVPFGESSPGTVIHVSGSPSQPLAVVATPIATVTATPGTTRSGPLSVRAFPAAPSYANGDTVRINGVLTDQDGKGISGARLFAIVHFPGGHSEVWVSPGVSGNNGEVYVTWVLKGANKGDSLLVDVYMTSNGQSFRGSTSFDAQ